MATDALYTPGALVVSGSSAYNIDGVDSVTISPSVNNILRNAGGIVDPSFVSAFSVSPKISLSFTDIATALTVWGINPFCFPQTTVYTTVDLYFPKITQCEMRASGSNHTRIRMNEGLIIPRMIEANGREPAKFSVDIIPTFDGTNNPFVYSTGSALPHTPVVDEMFVQGPALINGSSVAAHIGTTIDFGYEEAVEVSAPEFYATFVGIKSRRPKITLRSKDLTYLSSLTLPGTAQGATDSLVYLAKMTANAAQLAGSTNQHISFSIDDGKITARDYSGQVASEMSGEIEIQPVFDGTNAVMVLNLAATF